MMLRNRIASVLWWPVYLQILKDYGNILLNGTSWTQYSPLKTR
jgi:hypothetical protein